MRRMLTVQDFAANHPRYLVIVCDIQDDSIFMAHGRRQVSGRIKAHDGASMRVVKEMLTFATFESGFSHWIGGVLELLPAPLNNPKVSEFFKMLDGGIWNLAKAKWESKHKKKARGSFMTEPAPSMPDAPSSEIEKVAQAGGWEEYMKAQKENAE